MAEKSKLKQRNLLGLCKSSNESQTSSTPPSKNSSKNKSCLGPVLIHFHIITKRRTSEKLLTV